MGKVSNIRREPGSDIVCLEGNGSRPSHKGDEYKVGDAMYTLNGIEVHCVAYCIGSYHSNAWKSANPHSGVYETEAAKTLDSMSCGYPACNQGGVLILGNTHKSAAGFDGSMGAKAGNIGYAEEQAPTIVAGKEMHVVLNFKADGAVGNGVAFAIVIPECDGAADGKRILKAGYAGSGERNVRNE